MTRATNPTMATTRTSYGRKQNAGSNQDSVRELGSRRDPDSKDMREERAKRPGPR